MVGSKLFSKIACGHWSSQSTIMNCMNTTSESLLLRLQEPHPEGPNESAWKQFVELYAPLIFYWARKNGRSQTDASDLVQEVLTLVFQKLPEFRYDRTRSFRGWLRTVTLNKFRELARRKAIVNATTSEIAQIEIIDRAESTWDIDYARMLVAQTMEAMESDFAPATWQALQQVMSKGASVEQAAADAGVSPWTVYSAKSRVMKRLRNRLEGLL